MNILYYSWGENSTKMSVRVLEAIGHNVFLLDEPVANKVNDAHFEKRLVKEIVARDIAVVFTYNYFPCISHAVERTNALYASWIYDNPHYTVYEKSVFAPCNRIFHFDRAEAEKLKAAGVKNIYHMPLGVPEVSIGNPEDDKYDVSFVGSLYKNTPYDSINYLPPYEKGFLDSIINTQRTVYGIDFASELITDEFYGRLSPYLGIDMGEDFFITPREIFINMLQKKTTSVERVDLLKRAGLRFGVTLFSGDSDVELEKSVKKHGYIDHDTELPGVFAASKINLNISLRSITSGIPLRCMEIMRCGGFLLSNYQPELAEYFVDGEELAMFSSPDDMIEKIAYYLAHEGERKAIAKRGKEKVGKLFSLGEQFKTIFNITFSKETSDIGYPEDHVITENTDDTEGCVSKEDDNVAENRMETDEVQDTLKKGEGIKKKGSILIIYGVTYCYNILNHILENFGKALENSGFAVSYYDEDKEGVTGITRYYGQNFDAVIGVQTYLFNVFLKDAGVFLLDAIKGSKFNILLDHPGWLSSIFSDVPPDVYVLTHDTNYIAFTEKYYPKVAGSFLLPPGGVINPYLADQADYEVCQPESVEYVEGQEISAEKQIESAESLDVLSDGQTISAEKQIGSAESIDVLSDGQTVSAGKQNCSVDGRIGTTEGHTGSDRKYDLIFIGTYGDFRKKCEQIRECNPFAKKLALKYLIMLKRYINEPAEKVFARVLDELGIEISSDEQFLTLFSAMNPVVQLVMYYYREKTLRILAENEIDIHVWGETWRDAPFMQSPPYKEHIHVHGDLTPDEAEKVLAQSRMALNIMAWHKAGFTERLANTMLSKTVMLSDVSTYITEHFSFIMPEDMDLIQHSDVGSSGIEENLSEMEKTVGDDRLSETGKTVTDNCLSEKTEDSEIAIFKLDSLGRLPQFVNALLSDKKALAQMAENGYKRCLAEHTWDARAEQFGEILSMIG